MGQTKCPLRIGDEYAIANALKESAKSRLFDKGRQTHAIVVKRGFTGFIVLATALMDLRVKCGHLTDALKLFEEMPDKDVVSWTSLVVGHMQRGLYFKSMSLFSQMIREGVEPNCHSFSAALSACSGLRSLEGGWQIHAQLVVTGAPTNLVVENSLLHLYVRCCDMNAASKLFNRMPVRGLIAWNEMISGHIECGQPEEGLKLMYRMHSDNVKPDNFSLAICIRACSRLTSMNQGKQFHGCSIINGFESDLVISNALVDMYSRCGCLASAKMVFELAPLKDAILWTAMVSAYGKFGQVQEVLSMFDKMQKSNIQPDGVTYVALLSACCHGGLVGRGWHYFNTMYEKHSVSPQQEHYACMVDLLCRSGHFIEAYDLIKRIPEKPGVTIWGAFLYHTTLYGDIESSRLGARELLDLGHKNNSNYIAMSNLSAIACDWSEMHNIRERMKADNVKKEPGCSWIEVKESVHAFIAASTSHPQMKEILRILDSLNIHIKGSGYTLG